MKAERVQERTVGIVLLNLGGPDSRASIRPFLYNLFSDREIIKLGPPFLQKPLAFMISAIRSAKTRRMYDMIGGKSPINDITGAQAEALQSALNVLFSAEVGAPSFKVFMGMRYWHPFIGDVVHQIFKEGIRELIVLSLYPHYSKTTTGSAIAEFRRAVDLSGIPPAEYHITYIDRWFDYPAYIDSLAELLNKGIREIGSDDYVILYSAHGLPESVIRQGDPYLNHINRTIELTNRRLGQAPYNISGFISALSFQSRTGPVKWLEPSTDEMIEKYSREGLKNLLVVPISFVSDHVETLYEIDILFKSHADMLGINLHRCRSLNTSDGFINALADLVLEKGIKGDERLQKTKA